MEIKALFRVLALCGLLLCLAACQIPEKTLGIIPQESIQAGTADTATEFVAESCSVESPCDNEPILVEESVMPIGTPRSPATNPFDGCNANRDTMVESRMLEIINKVRAEHGLGLLMLETRLEEASLLHVLDIACNGPVSHNSSDGSTLADRLTRQGYPYRVYAENIYAGGAGTPDAAVDAMMASTPHRANLLNPEFTEIGISYALLEGSPYGYYYVVDFGAQ